MPNTNPNKQVSRGYNPEEYSSQQTMPEMQYFSLEDFSDYFDYEIMKQFKGQQPGGVQL